MKKILVLLLPIIFTAQACNIFNLSGNNQSSGPKGIFLSTDKGETWEASNSVAPNKSLAGVPVVKIFIEKGKTNNLVAAAVNGGLVASDNHGKGWIQLLPTAVAFQAFINPNNSQEIYVGGASGGLAAILKSTDRGATWTQVYSEPAGTSFVTALIFDDRTPRILYAGLSNGNFLKSTDGGTTWDSLADHNDRIDKIISVNGSLVTLGRQQGLKRSVDGGKTWTDLIVSTKDAPGQYNDLALDPENPSTIYLAAQGGLYRGSLDALTWEKVALPASPEVSNISAVAVDPKNSKQIYAAINSTVYRSDDRGATWRTVILPTRRIIATMVIDPEEPNRVYIGLK